MPKVMNQCLDCGRKITERAKRCGSCASTRRWADPAIADLMRQGGLKGAARVRGRPSQHWKHRLRDEPLTRFTALVMATITLELATMLWITGALRPL